MFPRHLKEFAKKASTAYALSASFAAEGKSEGNDGYTAGNSLLEKALSEAKKISEDMPRLSAPDALNYAHALLELARACALQSDLEMAEELFLRMPRKPKSQELDFVSAEGAYLLGELSLKLELPFKAEFVYRTCFPEQPSLGAALMRLDLAALLVRDCIERDEPLKAKSLFLSSIEMSRSHFASQIPEEQGRYAREEISRILSETCEGVLECCGRHPNDVDQTEIRKALEGFLKELTVS